MRPWVIAACLLSTGTISLVAQPPAARPAPTATLSLADALSQAQRNSPTYLQIINDAGAARWSVRQAYTTTLLPTVAVSGSFGYTGSGSATFSGTVFNQSSPTLSSGYGISLNWQLSGSTLSAPGQQRANQNAIGEDINNAGVSLRYDVTFQYLTALQAAAQSDVARQQVTRNGEFLQLAQARYQVGQATVLDVKQAQVQKGQADVALLRAVQTENEAKLELFRRMGITAPVSISEIALSDSFPVTQPTWQLDQLLAVASDQNPTIRAARARESSAGFALRAQRSTFLPTLRFSAGWQGYTQQFTNDNALIGRALSNAQSTLSNCTFQNSLILSLPGGGIDGQAGNGVIADCKQYSGLDATGESLLPDIRSRIVDANKVFPFSFTSQPFSAQVTISLPIFDGFQRNLSIAQARNSRDDAKEALRARELQVRTDVQARYLAVQTAYQAIAVQAANRDAARDQLQLAQDRYRLGSGSALDVTDAQNNVQRAEGDYVNAVYDYHKAIAALELAAGRSLR